MGWQQAREGGGVIAFGFLSRQRPHRLQNLVDAGVGDLSHETAKLFGEFDIGRRRGASSR